MIGPLLLRIAHPLLAASLAVAAGVAIVAHETSRAPRAELPRAGAETAPGRSIHFGWSQLGDGRAVIRLDYLWHLEGREHRGTATATVDADFVPDPERFREGAPVPVSYDPRSPHEGTPVGFPPAGSPWKRPNVIIGSGLCLVGSGYAMVWLMRNRRRAGRPDV